MKELKFSFDEKLSKLIVGLQKYLNSKNTSTD